MEWKRSPELLTDYSAKMNLSPDNWWQEAFDKKNKQ